MTMMFPTYKAVFSLMAIISIGTSLGCSFDHRDQQIKADLTAKAKDDLHFAGVYFTVNRSIVTLYGNFATAESKAKLMQKLRTVRLIDSVSDQTHISAVVISENFATKQKIDSLSADYPTVGLKTMDTNLVIVGTLTEPEAIRLTEGLREINATKIINQLRINR